MNKVIGDFIDENKPEEIFTEDEDSVIKSEIDPDNVITLDSDDEMNFKDEDWQFIEPVMAQFDRHNESVVDPKTPIGKNPKIDETPAKKIKSKKRQLIRCHSKKPKGSIRKTNHHLDCEICHDRSRSSMRLIYHRKKHLAEFPIHCRICLRFFSSVQRKSAHQDKCNKLRYDCYACGMITASLAQLKNHFRTHSGEKPFKCEKCPKKYAADSDLSTHMKRAHKIARKNSIISRK